MGGQQRGHRLVKVRVLVEAGVGLRVGVGVGLRVGLRVRVLGVKNTRPLHAAARGERWRGTASCYARPAAQRR